MYVDNKVEFTISYWNEVFGNKVKHPKDEQEKCFHALPLRAVAENTYCFWHLTLRNYFANKGLEDIV